MDRLSFGIGGADGTMQLSFGTPAASTPVAMESSWQRNFDNNQFQFPGLLMKGGSLVNPSARIPVVGPSDPSAIISHIVVSPSFRVADFKNGVIQAAQSLGVAVTNISVPEMGNNREAFLVHGQASSVVKFAIDIQAFSESLVDPARLPSTFYAKDLATKRVISGTAFSVPSGLLIVPKGSSLYSMVKDPSARGSYTLTNLVTGGKSTNRLSFSTKTLANLTKRVSNLVAATDRLEYTGDLTSNAQLRKLLASSKLTNSQLASALGVSPEVFLRLQAGAADEYVYEDDTEDWDDINSIDDEADEV